MAECKDSGHGNLTTRGYSWEHIHVQVGGENRLCNSALCTPHVCCDIYANMHMHMPCTHVRIINDIFLKIAYILLGPWRCSGDSADTQTQK